MYFILCRGYWKNLWNSESDESHWEIWQDPNKKTVTLCYNNYSNKDIKIKVPYDQFEDLVKFMIRIR